MWLLKKIPNNRPRNCLFQPSLYDSKAIQCECLRSPSIVNIFLSHFPASLPSISCFNDQFKVVILSAPKTLFNRRSSEISNVAWRSRSFLLFCFGAFFRESIFGVSRECQRKLWEKFMQKFSHLEGGDPSNPGVLMFTDAINCQKGFLSGEHMWRRCHSALALKSHSCVADVHINADDYF